MKVLAISGYKRSGKDTAAAYLVENGYLRVSFADVLKDMVASEYGIPRNHCDDPEHKEAPILTLPVIPKDDFTLKVANMLFEEFRTENGSRAIEPYIDPSGAFLGVMGRDVAQLYWTPRALCILKGSINRAVDSGYWVNRTIDQINLLNKTQFKIDDNQDTNYTISSNGSKLEESKFVISDLRYRSEVEQLKQAFGKNLVTVRINRFEHPSSNDPSERDLDNHKFDITIENTGTLDDLYYKLDMEFLND
jgi:hypothetical protein